MNEIGEKINVSEITKKCRVFDAQELMTVLRSDLMKFWSWGSHKFVIDSIHNTAETKLFKMTVSGHLHKGFVYIFLNGMDLFDIYLTSNRGTIKDIINDVYVDQLVNCIDGKIERIPIYQQ